MDETYIKIKGKWKYLYSAVHKEGRTIDFLLAIKRSSKALLREGHRRSGRPEKVNIDKSSANKTGIKDINSQSDILKPDIKFDNANT